MIASSDCHEVVACGINSSAAMYTLTRRPRGTHRLEPVTLGLLILHTAPEKIKFAGNTRYDSATEITFKVEKSKLQDAYAKVCILCVMK